MRHNIKGRKLSRSTKHRKALLRNLATELFRHNRIKTTEAKAKSVQPIAERLITLAKRGDLHARRLAARDIYDPAILQKLFDDIAPVIESEAGGYTRIYKLGPRQGDAANVALIEIVGV
ncbi:50S ribosomal protein L17 [Anaerolineales bacterium HSG6]|nr:50S ribosomal protein L17 [Anaerolineales bacterium HSG6]MDM8530063.1 50S ribosomal protein L17 [Anaerolineales bacterium HSG25]